MKKIVITLALFVAGLCSGAEQSKPNVLFIAVDDLAPRLGVYGDALAQSPQIDRLASMGTTFINAQCQYAKCGPSRASLMSGLRPESAGVLAFNINWREANPAIVSLPQYLKEHGYFTTGTGKIYDYRNVDNSVDMDAESWSEAFSFKPGLSSADVEQQNKAQATHYRDTIQDYNYTYAHVAAAPENPLVDFRDYRVAQEGIKRMRERAAADEPFFLAVGFAKPHLPFFAPKVYWDLYERDDFEIHPFQEKAADHSNHGYSTSGELKSYGGVPLTEDGQVDISQFTVDLQKELIHGYYACVSYIDALVGMLLDELEALNLQDDTIIVLWGDHGFHLGDHAQWAKGTPFEQAARAPLIIVDPRRSSQGALATSPAEFTDIYPTLCELLGLPLPDFLDGKSLAAVLDDPLAKPREGAVTIHSNGDYWIGYSVRNERYRYMEWVHPVTKKLRGRDLFDYVTDPNETQNLANSPEYSEVLDSMIQILHNDTAGLKLLQESRQATYAQWKGKYGWASLSDQVSAAADPNGNGLSNKLEYAMGLDPLAQGELNDRPRLYFEASQNEDQLVFTYRRNKYAGDVDLAAKVSDDLVVWEDPSPSWEMSTEDSDEDNVELITFRQDRNPSVNKMFMKLEVSDAP